MDQETMDAIRDVIVTALKLRARVDDAQIAPDEGNAVYATIDNEPIVLVIEPV